jgi:peroxiredoxin Q/BCP
VALLKLNVGDLAPPFQTQDIDGRSIDLSTPRKGLLLLAFHRFAACPFCNLRIHELTSRYDAYERKGLRAIAIFESSVPNLRTGLANRKLPFPVVSDPKRALYQQYGVEHSVLGVLRTIPHMGAVTSETKKLGITPRVEREGSISRMPADFLITPAGRIHTAFYGTNMNDHLDFAHIEDALARDA